MSDTDRSSPEQVTDPIAAARRQVEAARAAIHTASGPCGPRAKSIDGNKIVGELIERRHGSATVTRRAASDGRSELRIPERIGPIKLSREIGRGGMGVVWLGRHELLGRDVAVKFLTNAKPGTDDPSYAKLLAGARAAASVRHPNLTLVYNADLFEHVPYLVLEYVDGPNLSQIRAAVGRFELSVCLALLDLASAAVGELHKHGIVHRDIKPSNVMLDASGQVFVTDFGLACPRRLGDLGRAAETVAGTPPFMAPEVFDGAVSARSDVYALGITLFTLMTGELPFRGNLDEIRNGHSNEPLPIQRLLEQGVSAGLIEVIERATNKQAMYRHKTADHFRQALNEAVRNAGMMPAGPVELQSLAMLPRTSVAPSQRTPADKTPSSSYYDRISESAATKRRERDAIRVESPKPSEQPLMNECEVHVPIDWPCIHCSYNLCGLPISGRCPECGVSIAECTQPDRLLFADPGWPERVARGQLLQQPVRCPLCNFDLRGARGPVCPECGRFPVDETSWWFTSDARCLFPRERIMSAVGLMALTGLTANFVVGLLTWDRPEIAALVGVASGAVFGAVGLWPWKTSKSIGLAQPPFLVTSRQGIAIGERGQLRALVPWDEFDGIAWKWGSCWIRRKSASAVFISTGLNKWFATHVAEALERTRCTRSPSESFQSTGDDA